MNRRDFLTARRPKKKAEAAPFHVQQTQAGGLAPYTGAWTTSEVVHLLKRTMFGAKKSDIDYFRTKTLSQAVDELLNPTAPLPAPPVKEYDTTGAATPDTGIAPGTTWVNDYSNDGTIVSRRRASFKKWWMGVMIQQDRSIREKMTLFWHNHFATETVDIADSQFVYKHHALLRSGALGNFKTLVRQVTLDPGMLRYLNGYVNVATAPDENYARELQELFTLGKENNPNYTEEDVKAAARVLTGWRVNYQTISSFFDATRHSTANKQFSSFYGNKMIAGRTGATAGDIELDELLNMIFDKKDEVSRFLATKLYRWFCYYEIDATTKQNVIEPMAKLLRDNNWEVKPALSALLKSEHFFDAAARGCLIKSPVDLLVGLCREFNVVFPNASTEYVAAYNLWNFLVSQSSTMIQNIGDPPSVAGWPSYYQVPQFHQTWINSDTLPKRNTFTDRMISNGYSANSRTMRIDAVAFTKTLPDPGDPNKLIDDALSILFRVPISDTSKQTIKKQILLSNQDQDYYWTNAWAAHITNPNDTAAFNIVNTRLQALYKRFMNLAEYQLS
jgi:uncharacterized protein (DUF1800 family)